MKRILALLFFISSVTGYSQTNNIELPDYNIDCHGMRIQDVSIVSNSFYKQISVQSSLQYDSIRALSEINDVANADAYPWISPDGLRLYFIRGDNSSGVNQLMFTQRANTNSNFSSPTLVPLGVPTMTSCWFSNDELNVYICSDSILYFADRSNTSSLFNTPVEVNLNGYLPFTFIGGASLNAVQDQLYISLNHFMVNVLSNAEFTRTSPTSFSYVRTLTPPSGYSNEIGQLSKDDLTYFLSVSNNGGDASLYEIQRLAPTDSFDLNLIQQIPYINDLNYDNIQPSMSDSLNWVAFVRNNTGFWEGNDLYIARRDLNTSLFNLDSQNSTVAVFPNPTRGEFTVSVPTNNAEIRITDILGQEITQASITQMETNFQIAAIGVYLICIQTKNGTIRRKLIVSR